MSNKIATTVQEGETYLNKFDNYEIVVESISGGDENPLINCTKKGTNEKRSFRRNVFVNSFTKKVN